MEGWTDFFVAEVGAAAALAGLLVVAMSINIEKIMSFEVLPGRAAQTLVIIGGGLVMASCALIPRQPLQLLGAEVLVVGLVMAYAGFSQLGTALRRRNASDPLSWTILPMLIVAAIAVPTLIGGMLLIAANEFRALLGRRRRDPRHGGDARERLGAADRDPALSTEAAGDGQLERVLCSRRRRAGALGGLLLAAVSVNIEKILAYALLPPRVAQTLITIGAALVLSSFALYPGQPVFVFGWEAVGVGLVVVSPASGSCPSVTSSRRRIVQPRRGSARPSCSSKWPAFRC